MEFLFTKRSLLARALRPSSLIPEDFLGAGNCLGLEALNGQATWQYSAELMARTELLEIPLRELQADRSPDRSSGKDIRGFLRS